MSFGFFSWRGRLSHHSQNKNDQRHDENRRDKLQHRKRNQADQHPPQADDVFIVSGQSVEHFGQRTGVFTDRDHVGHKLGKEPVLVPQCLGNVGTLLHLGTDVGQLLSTARVTRFARCDFQRLEKGHSRMQHRGQRLAQDGQSLERDTRGKHRQKWTFERAKRGTWDRANSKQIAFFDA